MAAGICFIGHFLLSPTAYFFNRLFCVRNVSPTAHFSQQFFFCAPAEGAQTLKNFPLTDGGKHDTLEALQAMMGVAARSCGRKCPPEAPLAAQECGAIQIQVEPRTFQFALSCVGSSGRFLF